MSVYGAWAVMAAKPPRLGMGTTEWILVIGCGVIYFGVSFLTKPPSKEHMEKLFGK
jgi:hypothetical protein